MFIIERKALNHCCLSYISRACNSIEILLSDNDEQRNTFRAKFKENLVFYVGYN